MTLIAALVAGASAAVIALLAEVADPLASRLLGTAGFAALAALTGLCASLLLGRGAVAAVGILGIVAAAVTFFLGLAYVWGVIEPAGSEEVRPLGTAMVVSIALAWVSLLLVLLGRSPAATATALITVAAVTSLVGLLLAVIFRDGPPPSALARAAAVTAIIAVLGSFLSPMVAALRPPPARAWESP